MGAPNRVVIVQFENIAVLRSYSKEAGAKCADF